MGIAENLVQQITSTSGLTSVTKPQSFDLNDETFAKLLQKQMEEEKNTINNSFGEMGMPTGFVIEPLEGNDMADENVTIDNKTIEFKDSEPFEIKDIKIGDYFSEYLSDMSNNDSSIMNMAVKHAANVYKNLGRSYVNDMQEFTDDLVAHIKK